MLKRIDAAHAWLCFDPDSLFGAARESHKVTTRPQTWPAGETVFPGTPDGLVNGFEA